ncbi:MAG: hypothetical protein Fur002_02940 [Anaerolineales bacterium]
MPLDLILTPIYRLNGQTQARLPGLLTFMPPPQAARGRERERLMAYLLLAGNAVFSLSEYTQLAQDAAEMYYQTPGAMTTALRAAAEFVNAALLERNMKTSAQGQYALGWLTLAALRDSQCTLSLSGPMHVYWFSQGQLRHWHEPAVAGKGLGATQLAGVYYVQANLSAGDRLLFFGRAPEEWNAALNDATPMSLDAMRRRLFAAARADLNAALAQAAEGLGELKLLDGAETPAPQVDSLSSDAPAHRVQPSEYSPRPQGSAPQVSLGAREFPASIPRLKSAPVEQPAEEPAAPPLTEEAPEAPTLSDAPIRSARRTRRAAVPYVPSDEMRRAAKSLATFIQRARRGGAWLGEQSRRFAPRLLPTSEPNDSLALSSAGMFFMAVLIPLIVVTFATVFYMRYGRSQQYEMYLGQAQQMQAQARSLTEPVSQLRSWEAALLNVERAESYRRTNETAALRLEAETQRDQLQHILRMQFSAAFSSPLGFNVSRLAASDLDLFLLDAQSGQAYRAQPTHNGRGFQLDTTFSCAPGGGATQLVDILAMPSMNVINATLLGIDASGHLLYCAPGQLAKPMLLPPPDTGWKRITAFTMDNGNLYVLDAPARAVWVYNGKDGTFIDPPYFFFGGQTPEKQDVIDLAVFGDDLFMLHADGHLSTCAYSRIEGKPTRCEDPAPLSNPISAYQGVDLFASAHFTQMLFSAPPDSSLLLLDSDGQSVLRFSPRTLELQNQLRPMNGSANVIPFGVAAEAAAVSPNHVLYLAAGGQVYFAMNMP